MKDKDKKYLDKVIVSLVRGTKIDYAKERIHLPHSLISSFLTLPSPLPFFLLPHSPSYPPFFSKYCKNTFGLTDDEIKYVWNQYKDIITEKINQ